MNAQQMSLFDAPVLTAIATFPAQDEASKVAELIARLDEVEGDFDRADDWRVVWDELKALIGYERIVYYKDQSGECDICDRRTPRLIMENYDGQYYAWKLCPACARLPRPAPTCDDWARAIDAAWDEFEDLPEWDDRGQRWDEAKKTAYYAAKRAWMIERVPLWGESIWRQVTQ